MVHGFRTGPHGGTLDVMTDDFDDPTNPVASLANAPLRTQVYQDVLHPGAVEVGKSVAGLVRIALSPVRTLIWGFDRIEDFLQSALEKRLAGVDPESIQSPEPYLAGQILIQLPFCAEQEQLRELYANLLAAAMNKDKAPEVHPAFVQVIQQLTPDEALILERIQADGGEFAIHDAELDTDRQPVSSGMPDFGLGFVYIESSSALFGLSEESYPDRVTVQFRRLCERASVTKPDLSEAYLDNLVRLRIFSDRRWHHTALHDRNSFTFGNSTLENRGGRLVELTAFGKSFLKACTRSATRP